MSQIIDIDSFLAKAKNTPIIDVRSPGEFEKGHIPYAINIPLFTNEERAIVGTKYKLKGRENAILEGLDIVGRKLKGFVMEAEKVSNNNKLLVHCWRGGMRSSSMAWLFETYGIRCEVLKGGYKAYRRYIRDRFSQKRKVVILGGMTGSGKSEILGELKKAGEQIIDLEQIAHHKGSAFGALGQQSQPTNEQFENNLAKVWLSFNTDQNIWFEDESKSIGSVWIPDNLFSQMRNSPTIKLEIDKKQRIARLVKEYAGFEAEKLKEIIRKIGKRLGGQHVKKAIEALESGKYEIVADIALTYYDKTYEFGLLKRDPQTIHEVKIDKTKNDEVVKELIMLAETLF